METTSEFISPVLDVERSLFPFNHNDVVAKLCLDRRVCVDGFIHRTDRKSKRCVLERSDHRPSRHPAQIALTWRDRMVSTKTRAMQQKDLRYKLPTAWTFTRYTPVTSFPLTLPSRTRLYNWCGCSGGLKVWKRSSCVTCGSTICCSSVSIL